MSLSATMTNQKGFSVTSYLAALVVAGVVTASAVPSIMEMVDTSDLNMLKHARSALQTSLRINHVFSQNQGGMIEIDGQMASLRYGYPTAESNSLRLFAELEGFEIEEFGEYSRIWSPGRLYCMSYVEASANEGAKLTSIGNAEQGQCANLVSAL